MPADSIIEFRHRIINYKSCCCLCDACFPHRLSPGIALLCQGFETVGRGVHYRIV